jgi:hypothetical protein
MHIKYQLTIMKSMYMWSNTPATFQFMTTTGTT